MFHGNHTMIKYLGKIQNKTRVRNYNKIIKANEITLTFSLENNSYGLPLLWQVT
jgi:hypothetical protein